MFEEVPSPTFVWFKDGIPLSETPNLRFNVANYSQEEGDQADTLNINFLRLDDSGMFQCSASNEAGEVVGYTWLVVKSKFRVNFPRDIAGA